MATNKRRRHPADQIIRKLAEGNKLLGTGRELSEVCRHLEVTESTWHRWVAQYGGMKASPRARISPSCAIWTRPLAAEVRRYRFGGRPEG